MVFSVSAQEKQKTVFGIQRPKKTQIQLRTKVTLLILEQDKAGVASILEVLLLFYFLHSKIS